MERNHLHTSDFSRHIMFERHRFTIHANHTVKNNILLNGKYYVSAGLTEDDVEDRVRVLLSLLFVST